MRYAGPTDILDARLFYTPEESRKFFSELSLLNREKYILNEFLDYILILTYTTLFYRLSDRANALRRICFLPGFFDVVETTTILLCLNKFIILAPTWLGYVTSAKWGIGAIFVLWYLVLHLKKKTGAFGAGSN